MNLREILKTGCAAFFLMFAPFDALLAEDALEAGSVFQIQEIEYHISGRTKESALTEAAGIKKGAVFKNEESLLEYLNQKKQALVNTRIFSTVNIEYAPLDDFAASGAVKVDVYTTDTLNFLITPYPKYDSNTGFLLKLRMYDSNIFGLMSLLKADLGWSYSQDVPGSGFKNSALAAIDAVIPFTAAGLRWEASIFSDNVFSFDKETPFQSENVVGISANFNFGRMVLTAGFNETIITPSLNEARQVERVDGDFKIDEQLNKDEYIINKTKRVLDEWLLSSNPYVNLKIPVKHEFFEPLGAALKMGLGASFNYAPFVQISDENGGASIIAMQQIGYTKIDWLGNIRNGSLAYIQNDSAYNFIKGAFSGSVSAVFTRHKKITDFFGFSVRLKYKQWFNSDKSYTLQSSGEGGAVLRGVRDKSILSDLSFSANLDFPFLLFVFTPSEWFDKKSLRYFNFELYCSPILDCAFIKGTQFNSISNEQKNININFSDMFITGGMEFIFFPLSWRSLYLRFSLAFNMREMISLGAVPSADGREIFIGIGSYY
ncbi:MAG: hypothetical protein LBC53_01905 [Spirochaetaceae bacterium]|jgi:hypothetical protein|nr:hypothetical protein [Spirochaetaceae bacterium]